MSNMGKYAIESAKASIWDARVIIQHLVDTTTSFPVRRDLPEVLRLLDDIEAMLPTEEAKEAA